MRDVFARSITFILLSLCGLSLIGCDVSNSVRLRDTYLPSANPSPSIPINGGILNGTTSHYRVKVSVGDPVSGAEQNSKFRLRAGPISQEKM